MSPALANKTFCAYARDSKRTEAGGNDPKLWPIKKRFRGRIQAADPRTPVIRFGSMQVPVSHDLYTWEDVSALQKQDVVVDDMTELEYAVQAVRDESDLHRIWHVYLWRN